MKSCRIGVFLFFSIQISINPLLLGEKPGELLFSKWSGELNVPDPVAIAFDHKGNAYITQTQRRKVQDLDIRQHPKWIDPSTPREHVHNSTPITRAYNRLLFGVLSYCQWGVFFIKMPTTQDNKTKNKGHIIRTATISKIISY
jgi:hypothetical protein